jgi:hypothetical protein
VKKLNAFIEKISALVSEHGLHLNIVNKGPFEGIRKRIFVNEL